MSQIELHHNIEKLLKADPREIQRADIRQMISANEDAKQYFFAKADDRWLEWLWENGFLDAIKQKAKEPVKYGHSMPELYYLTSMAIKKPKEVTEIMLSVPI